MAINSHSSSTIHHIPPLYLPQSPGNRHPKHHINSLFFSAQLLSFTPLFSFSHQSTTICSCHRCDLLCATHCTSNHLSQNPAALLRRSHPLSLSPGSFSLLYLVCATRAHRPAPSHLAPPGAAIFCLALSSVARAPTVLAGVLFVVPQYLNQWVW